MFLTKLKIVTGVLVAVTALGLGAGALTYVAAAGDPPAKNAREDRPSGPAAPRTSGLDQSVQEPAPAPAQEEPAPDDGTAPWRVRADMTGGADEFTSVAFTPDGRMLAAGNLDGTCTLWDVASGKEVRRMGSDSGQQIYAVAITPDGKGLITGGGRRGEGGRVAVWGLASGITGAVVSRVHTDVVVSLAISPDGKVLASGSRDGTVGLWEAHPGTPRLETRLPRQTGTVFAVAFSPDGKLLASAGGEEFIREGNKAGELKLWDAATGREVAVLQGHTSTVTSVAFSPDGKTLASGGFDKDVRLWDVATGKLRSRGQGHSDIVRSVAFSPDGRTVASGSFDGGVNVWDAATGKQMATPEGPGGGILSVAFSPDGRLLASGGGEPGKPGRARLWEVKRASIKSSPRPGEKGGLDGLIGKPETEAAARIDRLDRLLDQLVKSNRTDEQIAEALYLATLGRLPPDAELKFMLAHVARAKDRREAFADILFTLTNSPDFRANVAALKQRLSGPEK